MNHMFKLLGALLFLIPLLQDASLGHGGQYRGPVPTTIGGPGDVTVSPTTGKGGLSWEEWWARNRYRYLHFPDILEHAASAYPTTPVKDASSLKGVIRSLRAESLEVLRPLLDDPSFRIRSAAVVGLGLLNDEESLEAVFQKLKEGNQWVKDSAILALGLMDSPKARHMLFHLARNTRTGREAIEQTSVPDYLQAFAQISLALSKTVGVEGLLQHTAENRGLSQDLRAMALEAIGIMGGEEAAKFLADFAADRERDSALLGAAVNAMSRTREPLVYPFLLKYINARKMEMRRSAALGLGEHAWKGDEVVVKLLDRAYRHTADQALKGFCLISMGSIGGAEAVKRLTRTARMGQYSSCPWACLGLGLALRESVDPAACAVLIKQLQYNGNRSFRGAAAVALGLAKSKEAVDLLIRMLKEGDDPFFRGYCGLSLGMISDPRALDPLKRALEEDSSPQVKIQSAMALAHMNERGSVPVLYDLLFNTGNFSTQAFLAQTLGFMGDIRIVDLVLAKLKKEKDTLDEQTLSCCMLLVARLLSGRTLPYLEPLAAHSNFANDYPMMRTLLALGI